MLVIKKDVPIPPRTYNARSSKYAALKNMDVMDCVFASSQKDANKISSAMKKFGFKVAQRKTQNDQFGLWRVA
ncbi:MAG: hypothetical protein ACPHQD_13270 [Vibrio toranzoniae]|uniref:hypothetical protein n=1 Tax=Vibrio toranzoniae TaxID=1194427 RepID=UPI003C6AAA1D